MQTLWPIWCRPRLIIETTQRVEAEPRSRRELRHGVCKRHLCLQQAHHQQDQARLLRMRCSERVRSQGQAWRGRLGTIMIGGTIAALRERSCLMTIQRVEGPSPEFHQLEGRQMVTSTRQGSLLRFGGCMAR